MSKLILISYTLWNIFVFAIYGLDKFFAKEDKRRIPEKTLLSCGLFFGGIGAWVGMEFFRHKTKHTTFRILIPVFALINIAVLYWLLS